MCGRVSFPEMKYHDVLQVHPSIQAHREHLKAYVKIGISERGKVGTHGNPLQGCVVKETNLIEERTLRELDFIRLRATAQYR